MNPPRKVLLLIGSPRAPKSNSEAIGRYLLKRMGEVGESAKVIRLRVARKNEAGRAALRAALAEADLILLAAPLYVDALPSFVMGALEEMREALGGERKDQGFAAFVQCGFPEQFHNEVALEICAEFARQAGLTWLGGLPIGMGEMIGRKPLEKPAGPLARLGKALDLCAAALARGEAIPDEARALLRKPLLPVWLYLMFGNLGWKPEAKKSGCRTSLYAQPYLDAREGRPG